MDTQSDNDPFLGRTLGSYRILKKLGEGGMGAVYRAIHATLEREVAFKILPQHLVHGNRAFVERFLVEARAAAKVDHENIVRVYDAGEENGIYYIAMEFVRGMDLQGLLSQSRRLSDLEAIDIVQQAVAGLSAAAEANIIHRDIKPANLMITPKGRVKVADFGLAKNLESATNITQSGQVMGTPTYMSPEQAEGEKTDFRSDIYSLGVSLFEMLTGEKPFRAETPIALLRMHIDSPIPDPAKIREGIHPRLCEVVRRMMAKAPTDRYSSYGELADELRRIRADLESSLDPENLDEARTLGVLASPLSNVSGLVERSLSDLSPAPTGRKTPALTPPTMGKTREKEAPREPPSTRSIHPAIPIAGGAALLALIATLAILAALGVFSGSTKETPRDREAEAWKALDRARALKDRGDVQAALSSLDDLAQDHPLSEAASKITALKQEWAREAADREAQARRERVKTILERATSLESQGNLQEALKELSGALALEPGSEPVVSAKSRLEKALEERAKATEQESNYQNAWIEAQRLHREAERSDGEEDWVRVAVAVKKAQAIRDTRETQELLALASGREAWSRARTLEASGDIDKALDLARSARGFLPSHSGLETYFKGLQRKAEDVERSRERKSKFDALAGEAEAEEAKGPSSDAALALAKWKQALLLADDPADRIRAERKIGALTEVTAGREAARQREERLARAEEALARRETEQAAAIYQDLLKASPGDDAALEGLRRVEAARVAGALADGRKAEGLGDKEGAIAAYEKARQLDPSNAEAREALERIRDGVAGLPAAFRDHFTVPSSPRDGHGNPACTRNGKTVDPSRGWACEIWLKEPRMEFVLLPSGPFQLGSPSFEAGHFNNEGPVKTLSIDRTVFVAKYEVTQAQWREVMGGNPSEFKGDDLPVENVSWEDCREFIRALNERVRPLGSEGGLFRLLSEAEWECACRGGERSRFCSGETEADLARVGWFSGNADGKTHPVGRREPNAVGLFDMHGNVWEWCEDTWHDGHEGVPLDGRPRIEGGDGTRRILRGGAWKSGSETCRSACRGRNPATAKASSVGFRICFSVPAEK